MQLLLRTLGLSHALLHSGRQDAGAAMDASCQALQQLLQLDLVLRRTCEKLVRALPCSCNAHNSDKLSGAQRSMCVSVAACSGCRLHFIPRLVCHA